MELRSSSMSDTTACEGFQPANVGRLAGPRESNTLPITVGWSGHLIVHGYRTARDVSQTLLAGRVLHLTCRMLSNSKTYPGAARAEAPIKIKGLGW